jgi:hypothetical protein
MIPVMSDGTRLRIAHSRYTLSEFYDQSALISNDIDRVSGHHYQRGAGQDDEAHRHRGDDPGSANARPDRLAAIEGSLSRLGARVIGLMAV